LDETTGVISGTPTTPGDFTVTIEGTNSAGTVSETYTGTIGEQLASTGMESAPLLALATALTMTGAALILIRRRTQVSTAVL